ncbi:hypothetical protein OG780_27045 [Streptomyces sp. NBC_00386]|uniref:hypothetical protein n=1 Tax=Streptomyces sp. NBC_00386 TaxID=2975734 RepID=UPI002E20B332
MKLLTACWCAAAARYAPMVLALTVIDFVADGFTWDSVREAAAVVPPVLAVVSLGAAAFAVRSLRGRARAAGIALSAGALDDRQTHVLRPVRLSDGWQEQVREELMASERSFLVAEKGREEIHFRWRPWRGEPSVWGSMSFDAPSGGVVLDVRDGEGLRGVVGLGKGSVFTAVCQIAGAAGLEGVPAV